MSMQFFLRQQELNRNISKLKKMSWKFNFSIFCCGSTKNKHKNDSRKFNCRERKTFQIEKIILVLLKQIKKNSTKHYFSGISILKMEKQSKTSDDLNFRIAKKFIENSSPPINFDLKLSTKTTFCNHYNESQNLINHKSIHFYPFYCFILFSVDWKSQWWWWSEEKVKRNEWINERERLLWHSFIVYISFQRY